MKRIVLTVLMFSLLLVGCGSKPPTVQCIDALGCVKVGSDEPFTIAVALTLSGPDAPYGIDALRGVELAIADRGKILNHPIKLIQEDDLCSAEGGQAAAERLAGQPNVLGVIGATCSSATEKAAKVLSDAGMVLISPSSTAASLTAEAVHQAGFLRTIYNDKSQAKVVAEFAYTGLGARTMATIHDGTPYSEELQDEACKTFVQLGGRCVKQAQITSGAPVDDTLKAITDAQPEVLYYPLYTTDGIAVTNLASKAGMTNVALISSDGLLSSDFVDQTQPDSEGMYISGPSVLKIDSSFYKKYQERYNEKPIAVYAAQAYDAAMILFNAIEGVAKTTGRDVFIPRNSLRAALFNTKNFKGLSGTITCSPLGDCATPNIVIYQVQKKNFVPIYP